MILAIDIGNTMTSFGLFRGGRLAQRFDIPTTLAEHGGALKKRLGARMAGKRVEQVLV